MPPKNMSTALTPFKKKSKLEETAEKIDAKDLSTVLENATRSNVNQDDMLHLMNLAVYFARAFSEVKFPLFKKLKETPVSKIALFPVSNIPEPVNKVAVDWIKKCDAEAVVSFALWSIYSILADFQTLQLARRLPQTSDQRASQAVALFTVLRFVLHEKPEVLVDILPTLSNIAKYRGQDKLPLIAWMIAQACLVDPTVGLYAWTHCLLPIVGRTSTCNSESIDLILQTVERILSPSNVKNILKKGAVREGKPLIPPALLDVLLRVTFPPASAHFTEREIEKFEAVYPILKKVALAGIPGGQEMEQVSRQIFSFSIKAWDKDNDKLSTEATKISVWCLTEHGHCYNQWETLYDGNLKASVAILKKLSAERQQPAANRMSLVPRKTLLLFKNRNERVLRCEQDASLRATYEDAQKYCTMLLGGRFLSSQIRYKGMRLVLLVVGIAVFFAPSNLDPWNVIELLTIVKSWDWTKIWEFINAFDWNELSTLDWNHLLEMLGSWDSYRPS